MIIRLTPSHQKFIFSLFLFCFNFSEPPTIPRNKRTHWAILGAILLLFVALAVVFCLQRDGISFIERVFTWAVGKCKGMLRLPQWYLVGRAKDAKPAVMCRAVPRNREQSYPKCLQYPHQETLIYKMLPSY